MRISHLVRIRHHIVAGLILPLFLWCVDASAFVRTLPQEEEIKVTIRSVQANPDHILITYSLSAPADGSYEVSLVLLKEGNPSFRIPVMTASGDVGEGEFTGDARQVKWEYQKDYPSRLYGDGFYFEITVSKVGKSKLLWYVGGGVVAGVLAYVFWPPLKKELPLPPTRPAQ